MSENVKMQISDDEYKSNYSNITLSLQNNLAEMHKLGEMYDKLNEARKVEVLSNEKIGYGIFSLIGSIYLFMIFAIVVIPEKANCEAFEGGSYAITSLIVCFLLIRMIYTIELKKVLWYSVGIMVSTCASCIFIKYFGVCVALCISLVILSCCILLYVRTIIKSLNDEKVFKEYFLLNNDKRKQDGNT